MPPFWTFKFWWSDMALNTEVSNAWTVLGDAACIFSHNAALDSCANFAKESATFSWPELQFCKKKII